MFLSGVLFVVFLGGCWLYCLTDAALAPPADFPWLGKRIWIAVMLVLPVLGALPWVIARPAAPPVRLAGGGGQPPAPVRPAGGVARARPADRPGRRRRLPADARPLHQR